MSTPLHALSIRELAAQLARRDITAAAVAAAFLDRVAELDHSLQAWQYLDAAQVLHSARELDAAGPAGALFGVPIGVKDLIDTADMPTTYGSPMYAGHQPVADAACVALARSAGALVMGKTVTTEFAYFNPGPTRNPHSSAARPHTPGGSSSGSAAAVAAGMVPVAFGTQTAGSILRPAAYCGVVGYKPTLGTLPVAGIKSLAPSMDTVGVLARSVADAAFVVGALRGGSFNLPTAASCRVGLYKTPHWARAGADTRAALQRAATAWSRAGAVVYDQELPSLFDGVAEAQKTIMAHEMAAAFAPEIRRHRADPAQGYSPAFAALMDAGLAVTPDALVASHALTHRARHALQEVFAEVDVLLVPSTEGEAPAGLDATGDPVFNRMWSLLGNPCVHVPMGTGAQGLPVGVTVVGPLWGDAMALGAAQQLADAADAAAADGLALP